MIGDQPARDNQTGDRIRRISIVGATGSGKTWLARDLASRLGLPLHELDRCRCDAAGRALSGDEFSQRVAALVATDEWVIDGHYRQVRDAIWRRADTVVWLNYPMPLILSRLLRRFISKSDQTVPENDELMRPRDQPSEVGGTRRPTWGHRLRRLARTVRERGEYGRLLRSPELGHLSLVELTSARDTRLWRGRLQGKGPAIRP